MKNVHLITQLVINAYHRLSSVDQYKKQMAALQFRKEFGTVKISLPRGTGHTTAAYQLLERFKDSILIVESFQHLIKLLPRREDDYHKININNRIIVAPAVGEDPAAVYHRHFTGNHWSLLILDPAARVMSTQLDDLLMTVNSRYDLLVLLE